MTTDRMTRVNELLKREIGERLFKVMDGTEFDMAAITVTRVVTSRNLRHARVMVSIRDHQGERGSMLSFLKRQRVEMQRHINKDLNLKYTPRISFELDSSIEKGDHILGILSEMEDEYDANVSELPEDSGGEKGLSDED